MTPTQLKPREMLRNGRIQLLPKASPKHAVIVIMLPYRKVVWEAPFAQ
jgi:hypothetical protein